MTEGNTQAETLQEEPEGGRVPDNFQLPESCANVQGLVEWCKDEEESDDMCRPCTIPIVTAWYLETLAENGQDALALELQGFAEAEGTELLQLAGKLDSIKDAVGAESSGLLNRLKELDCTLQINASDISREAE